MLRVKLKPFVLLTLVWGIVLVHLVPQVVADQSSIVLEPQDFAYAKNIEVSGKAVMYSITLPEDVYRFVTRSDLADLRVFNSAGAIVPHQISHSSPMIDTSLASAPIPFFPIEGSSKQVGGNDAVEISQDSSGRTLRVWMTGNSKHRDNSVSWYLLDLRSLKDPIRAIAISAKEIEPNRIVDVQLEGSLDLKSWRKLPSSGVLARLNYLGQEVEENRIQFSSEDSKFLRLSVSNLDRLAINAITGEYVNSKQSIKPEHWQSLRGVVDDKFPNSIFYENEGFFPVRSFRLRFPEANTLVSVRLSSRSDTMQPWSTRFSGTAYRLVTKDGELVNSPLAVYSTTNDRYWRVEVRGHDSLQNIGIPNLELGWVSDELHFVAQGQAPFRLMYGSARASLANFGLGDFSTVAKTQRLDIEPAILAEVSEVLGGMAARVAAPKVEPLPWKKWILWLVLMGFLALVASMAVQLFKDLKKT